MSGLLRRDFLRLAGAGATLLASPALRAAPSPVAVDALGTTFALRLTNAPFPFPTASYKDDTVLAFVPRHHRVARDGRVHVLVHFHGHNTTAERTIAAHQLREQLDSSRQNAILLVPQGPVMAPDSHPGKLGTPGGLRRLVHEALAKLSAPRFARVLGRAAVPAHAQPGYVCISAHSGGYYPTSKCLKLGEMDVREVYLFDALYGEVDVFRDWVIAGRGRSAKARHKLVNYYGVGATEANSQLLLAALESAQVKCAYERVEGTLSREELVRAEAVFVRSSLSHRGMTHEYNELRDCLYASAFPRRLPTGWFASVRGARPLERAGREIGDGT